MNDPLANLKQQFDDMFSNDRPCQPTEPSLPHEYHPPVEQPVNLDGMLQSAILAGDSEAVARVGGLIAESNECYTEPDKFY